MDCASAALAVGNHLDVQITEPISDRNAASEGNNDFTIRVIDRNKARAIGQTNTVKVSNRYFVCKSQMYSWNSATVIAPAPCTRGQLPALQKTTLLEEGMLLSGQYAAAAYCSKKASCARRSGDRAGHLSTILSIRRVVLTTSLKWNSSSKAEEKESKNKK